MVVRLIHWLCGWVAFSLSGADCGRFLSDTRQHIFFVKKRNGETMAGCSKKDYPYVVKAARKHHCKTRVKQRFGLPFFIRKYRLRVGLLLGAGIMLVSLLASTMFVWEVEVNGNLTSGTEEILAAAAEEGLKPGALISGLDISTIEFDLKQQFPEIAWIAINRNATHFTIEISEVTPQPERVDKSQPCNVASTYDGIIQSIEPYSGFPQVKAGDVVKKDQLLVSGIKEEENGTVLYAHASAKVVAQVERTFDYVRPLYTVRTSKTGEVVQRKMLSVFGLKIPLSFQGKPDQKYIETTTEEPIELFGLKTPFSMITIEYELLDETQIDNDPEQLKRLLMDDAKAGEEEALAGDKILSREYVYETTEDSMILHCTDLVEQEIGEERPIVVTEAPIS